MHAQGPSTSRAPAREGATRPDAVMGDKAYSSRANRYSCGPGKSGQSFPTPGTRSATANAARYDELAITYRSGVALCSVLNCYANKETRPVVRSTTCCVVWIGGRFGVLDAAAPGSNPLNFR